MGFDIRRTPFNYRGMDEFLGFLEKNGTPDLHNENLMYLKENGFKLDSIHHPRSLPYAEGDLSYPPDVPGLKKEAYKLQFSKLVDIDNISATCYVFLLDSPVNGIVHTSFTLYPGNESDIGRVNVPYPEEITDDLKSFVEDMKSIVTKVRSMKDCSTEEQHRLIEEYSIDERLESLNDRYKAILSERVGGATFRDDFLYREGLRLSKGTPEIYFTGYDSVEEACADYPRKIEIL